MTEKGLELGYVAVSLQANTLSMLHFHINGDVSDAESAFYMDTLMRSAASYGESKGADFLETRTAEYNEFFRKKGFDTDETHAFAPMSTIVRYTNQ